VGGGKVNACGFIIPSSGFSPISVKSCGSAGCGRRGTLATVISRRFHI
jgi:hypothetical protein